MAGSGTSDEGRGVGQLCPSPRPIRQRDNEETLGPKVSTFQAPLFATAPPVPSRTTTPLLRNAAPGPALSPPSEDPTQNGSPASRPRAPRPRSVGEGVAPERLQRRTAEGSRATPWASRDLQQTSWRLSTFTRAVVRATPSDTRPLDLDSYHRSFPAASFNLKLCYPGYWTLRRWMTRKPQYIFSCPWVYSWLPTSHNDLCNRTWCRRESETARKTKRRVQTEHPRIEARSPVIPLCWNRTAQSNEKLTRPHEFREWPFANFSTRN